MPEQSSLAKLLALALMVAVVCNGASFYLKRTGLVDHEAYRAYWATHCWGLDELPMAARERQCSDYTTPEEIARVLPPIEGAAAASYRYVYEVSAAERPLKLLKDLFWLVLVAVSFWLAMRERTPISPWRRMWPVSVLAAYSAMAFLVSIPINGTMIAAAGLRAFTFLFAALLGQWLVPHLTVFARSMGALLIVEALLVPFELFRGIHLFHEWTPFALASRVAGTLVQPNSMGVFAAAALAFYYSFSPSRSWLVPLSIVALALVLLSGSATGLICAALALFVILRQRVSDKWRVFSTIVGVLGIILTVMMLPSLTARENVFDSVWGVGGRLTALHSALFGRGLTEVVFGSGLGVNTNTALNLAATSGLGRLGLQGLPVVLPTDSALTGFVIQIGLIGTLMFFGTLLWAALRDPRARPFYGIVAVSTLTINVTELFPVNVLLGMALAHSAWNPSGRE